MIIANSGRDTGRRIWPRRGFWDTLVRRPTSMSQAGGLRAKVSLHDFTVAQNQGFADHELHQITHNGSGKGCSVQGGMG